MAKRKKTKEKVIEAVISQDKAAGSNTISAPVEHIAKSDEHPQEVAHKPEPEKLRAMQTIPMEGVTARFVDDFTAVGIQFDFKDQDERPSEAVRGIVKNGGFHRDFERGQWRKRVSRENPIADRYDAEGTFAEAIEQMRKDREQRKR